MSVTPILFDLRLGSTSDIKVSALLSGLSALVAVNPDVVPAIVPSGIPEQPWGHDVTRADTLAVGALNRALGAYSYGREWNEIPDTLIGAGIENGLTEIMKDVFIDHAVVVLFHKHQWYYATSAGVPFPAKYVHEAKRRIAAGEKNLTVGKVISQYTGCDHTDPHSYLTNGRMPRRKILTDAVMLCGAQFLCF